MRNGLRAVKIKIWKGTTVLPEYIESALEEMGQLSAADRISYRYSAIPFLCFCFFSILHKAYLVYSCSI